MYKIKVIFARSYKPISLAIQLRTLCKWSHVGLLIETENVVIEARGGFGVVRTNLDDFKSRYVETEIREVYSLYDNTEEMILSLLGSKYDYKSFIGIALFIGWDDINAYQCTELILNCIGYMNKEMSHSMFPKDLLKISNKTC